MFKNISTRLSLIIKMGFLKTGEPLDWETSKKHLGFVKDEGISQFIKLYNKHKSLNKDTFVWGDVFIFGQKLKKIF